MYYSAIAWFLLKYHFGDAKKIKELITMITNAMEDEELEELPYKERLKIDLAKSEERYFRGEKERLEMLSEISEKNKKLAQKDKKIAQKDKKLAQKDKKIAQLQKILLENNIII